MIRALYSKLSQELRLTNLDAVMRLKIKRNLREANHVESLRKSFENSTQPEEELYASFKTEYQALDSRLAGLVTEKKMLDAEKKIVLQVLMLTVSVFCTKSIVQEYFLMVSERPRLLGLLAGRGQR